MWVENDFCLFKLSLHNYIHAKSNECINIRYSDDKTHKHEFLGKQFFSENFPIAKIVNEKIT